MCVGCVHCHAKYLIVSTPERMFELELGLHDTLSSIWESCPL